ncbi:secondary thiamine-phosphate synthase enzyme YjbQ [Sedimentisphaera salicampi]|uniref:Secondary thiamine-phosphate synthase enzyme n=1 Tax=Sedimentisphaera salicampi TaxID=1941349 RepID=A0A1W6LJG8_9BACT|nr:secondary thiamine-phosphate synthase enzyme YjbQ [Sedimentisphaera salicampi]ARN55940.1 secondary thiamine-phosphate synthase enzyme [Sedimentisphaera salicampi]OXU15856.1 secondary thiamine-phosphate synthase enzyme [Sedimentisphaera salicampi]
MKYEHQVFRVATNRRCQMKDITQPVMDFIRQTGIKNGRVTVYCPHTTAAITTNENADPDVQRDILLALEKQFPKDMQGFKHCEGNSDGHIKSSLIGVSEDYIISEGAIALGTWQSIFFCEFDGPRTRKFMALVEGS